jgi:D-alanyl-D-alanine endopeptidase (penicillin-binding protein 7)
MTWANAIGWAVLHAVWQGALLSGAYLLARRHLRGAGAAAHHALAWSALLTHAGLFSFTLLAYRIGIDVDWLPSPAPLTASTAGALPLNLAVDASTLGYVWALGVGALVLRLAVASSVLLPRIGRHAQVVSPAWAQRSRRLCRTLGLGAGDVQVLESPRVDSPLAYGVRRPVIVMPSQTLRALPAALVASLLAHEIAHVRRRDYLANLFQSCLEAALSLQPTAWWLGAQIRMAREHCCDDVAVAACGDARLYAQALYALESSRHGTPALAMTATHGSLVRRVERLVNRPHARPRTTRSGAVLATATLLSAALVAAILVVPAAAGADRRAEPGAGDRTITSVAPHAGEAGDGPSTPGATERLERIEFERDVPAEVRQQVLTTLAMREGAVLHGEARHRIAQALHNTRRGMTFTDRPGTRAGLLRIIVSLDC